MVNKSGHVLPVSCVPLVDAYFYRVKTKKRIFINGKEKKKAILEKSIFDKPALTSFVDANGWKSGHVKILSCGTAW